MATFQCKMCGGALEINEAQTIATCKFCGTKQTLPKLNSDRKTNLYERAGHFRRNNDFDKAMAVYEQILDEDLGDAESYWSILLCRYGVEYVEDPASGKQMITINRAQYTSIFDDEDYKSALRHADAEQRALYEKEAAEINEIQKGYLAISQKESPFDVFICYKESDERGRRTRDSVLATELYGELVREGFKVFFARITLEDKLGEAYEPYIFSALHSSKVMVVLGTRPEYFEAVWVKNEWGRYLSLIKNGAKKTLIPAYRDMDPYDLPEEFSHLQAQDMSKLGFMHDLVWAIRKLVTVEKKSTEKVQPKKQEPVFTAPAPTNAAPLLKRCFMFLEDGEWENADAAAERALDIDPENAQAYLAKLMCELEVRKPSDLATLDDPFDDNHHYQKILRFADDELKATVKGYLEQIDTRNKNALMEESYRLGAAALKRASTEKQYKEAAAIFQKIKGYKDADALATLCIEKAEIARKDLILSEAKGAMGIRKITACERAIELLQTIPGWRDADALIVQCREKIKSLQEQAEAERLKQEQMLEIKRQNEKKRKKIKIIVWSILCGIVAVIILLVTVILPTIQYRQAVKVMNAGNYIEAISEFEALDGYRDSKDKIYECNTAIFDQKYNAAVALMEVGKYTEAVSAFDAVYGYRDSKDKINECKYNFAVSLMEEEKYTEAIFAFEKLGNYFHSSGKILEVQNKVEPIARNMASNGDYSQAYDLLESVGFTIESNAFMAGCWGMSLGGSFDFLSDNPNCVSVEIPEGVTSIGSSAFYGCDSLTSVTIGNSVTSIGSSAFYGCDSLTSIEIPNSVTSIGDYAFAYCDNLTSITIPNSVTSIGSSAFYDCSSLTSVTIGNSVMSIGNYAFYRCYSLTSIEIPNSVTSIGDWAFSYCDSLTSIEIPNSMTSIGNYVFSYCDNLTSITIPNSVRSIGYTAFADCDSLTSIQYRGSGDQWGTIFKAYNWNYNTGSYTITYDYTGE